MSFPVAQLPSSLAHQGSTTSLTAQVSSGPAFPTPVVTTSSGPTSGLLSAPPPNYGAATAPPTVAGSTLSINNPSSGSINSTSQGHAQAAEAKRNAIQAAWTEAEGEIPVVDKDHDPWTLIFDGTLAIKDSPKGKSWKDGYGVLLNSHLLLFEKETTPTGMTKYSHMIKPIPLDCLRSVSFGDDAEDRKQNISLFNKIGSGFRSPPPDKMYPFTICHAAAKITRRYTLYALSPRDRNRWHSELDSVIEAQKTRQHGNELYRPQTLDDNFFRVPPRSRYNLNSGTRFTDKALCAAEISYLGVHYLAVGCTKGIYVRERESNSPFRIVLESHKPTSIVAIPDFNLFLVHCESALFSYPLDLVISVSQTSGATPRNLDDSEERLNQEHEKVLFFKAGQVAGRTLIVYATKGPKPKQVTLHVLELDAQCPSRYKRLGSPLTLMPASEDPHDATFCSDKVVICTSKTLHIVENIGATNMASRKVVPEVQNNDGGKNVFPRMLKRTKTLLRLGKNVKPKILELMDGSEIIGTVRCENDKTFIIYEEFGCFIDDQGKPLGQAYYVPWETRATAYALRGDDLLLFSPGFIEVRNVNTGKLVQIKAVDETRLLHSGWSGTCVPIAVMPGGTDSDGGRTERLVEFVYHSN